jgi:hypothetical protein
VNSPFGAAPGGSFCYFSRNGRKKQQQMSSFQKQSSFLSGKVDFSPGVFILPCGKTMECLQFELLFSAAVCYNGHTMTI